MRHGVKLTASCNVDVCVPVLIAKRCLCCLLPDFVNRQSPCYEFMPRAIASPHAPQKPLVRKRARSGGTTWVQISRMVAPSTQKGLTQVGLAQAQGPADEIAPPPTHTFLKWPFLTDFKKYTCAPPPPPPRNWSALHCSEKYTEQCGYDHAPVTRGRMRAQYPLPHGPPRNEISEHQTKN